MSLRQITGSPLFYVPVILFFLGRIFFYGPSSDRVRLDLEKSGYKQVEVTGPVGGCGKGSKKFTFTAVSPTAGMTPGHVCADIFGFWDYSISQN
jgi:hypothetical protein